ncbi:hypothetical protein EXT46_06050 [Pseudoalteromonas sp. CO325X]|uniref:hypothetical protein n=1 Tax=Pseudoalteromonas sp. CO325X TaxID=1777262 RepID=UPI001023B06E|nr:hypothetical protein [Pseudoalteromonas sp. CO325X]RZF83013.1 hypothetical protein EXT46_06050 [Pseudoalteromonas sp. CO325X]
MSKQGSNKQMQYSQLSKGARHHIKADLLPERVALQTKTHHVIVTFRFLLLFFSISAAVVAVFDDSPFYAVVAPILLIPCLFCWLKSHYLVLDAAKGQAYIESRFAGRAGTPMPMGHLENVKIVVQPIPSRVTHYQFALCGQRYTLGTLADTQAAARFLAQHFGCQLSVKESVTATEQTISFGTDKSEEQAETVQNQTTDTPPRVGRELYFWDKTALAKFIFGPFFFLLVVGLIAKELHRVF